tara:strand:- start:2157 stop:3080 length:924 start_codon:yes stop_codon:yes gene_type:complete
MSDIIDKAHEGDNWCLYKALAYALEMNPSDLNEEIMEFIENKSDTIFHGTPLSEWISGESGLTPQEYARKHRDRRACGGSIEMAVCAHIKKRNIRVSEWREYPRGYHEVVLFGERGDSTSIELVYIANKWYECLKYNFFAATENIEGGTEDWRKTWEEFERLEEIEKRLENGESVDSDTEEVESEEVGIVVNGCYGGFELSEWARDQFKDRAREDGYIPEPERTDPRLIQLVETHGSKVNGPCSSLRVEYMPKDYAKKKCYTIKEYDGAESLVLQYDKYKVVRMTEIINSTNVADNEKIVQLKKIIQ